MSKQKRHQIKSQPKKSVFLSTKRNELLRLHRSTYPSKYSRLLFLFGCSVALFGFRCVFVWFGFLAIIIWARDSKRPLTDQGPYAHCCMWQWIKLRLRLSSLSRSHLRSLSQNLSTGR